MHAHLAFASFATSFMSLVEAFEHPHAYALDTESDESFSLRRPKSG